MAIKPSLPGRLRNTQLRRSHALLPLFEAVVNAVQSVDEVHDRMDSARVTVEIVRQPQQALDFVDQGWGPTEPILNFIVSDNGEGFHDENMNSFETLDSEYKSAYGGRGVGRLLWLKAFERVEVESCYLDSLGALKRCSFLFSASSGISRYTVDECESSRTGSVIRLISFREVYRKAAPKNADTIARSILEH